jgi:hypothetical protein
MREDRGGAEGTLEPMQTPIGHPAIMPPSPRSGTTCPRDGYKLTPSFTHEQMPQELGLRMRFSATLASRAKIA